MRAPSPQGPQGPWAGAGGSQGPPAPALAQGGNCEISGKSDSDDFRRLLAAMEVLGFSGEDQDSIFRILASILHLGNVYFEKYEVREPTACHGALAPSGHRSSSQRLAGHAYLPFRFHHAHIICSLKQWGCSSSYGCMRALCICEGNRPFASDMNYEYVPWITIYVLFTKFF